MSAETEAAAVGRDERRMQVRAYNFWASLLGDRMYPPISELHPEELPDFGPYSVLLDFAEGIEDPLIAYVGELIAAESDVTGDIFRLADVPGRSLLSRITDHYMQILGNQAPVGFEAEFVNQRGQTVLYRGILMPFSRDDIAIDYIYGVINWKTLEEEEARARAEARPAGSPEDAPRLPAMLREAAPMTEWADGPADSDFAYEPLPPTLELPSAQFGLAPGEAKALPAHDGPFEDLADWLAAARDEAHTADNGEARSRRALYCALARCHGLALAAQENPDDYAALVADAGLVVQPRAPLVALVKLVFGADYDKTRLTEFATAIAHAQRLELAPGGLGELLATTPGGLKAVVRAERDLRRAEAGDASAQRGRRADLREGLRQLPARTLDTAAHGNEFAVIVARRAPDGSLVLLGEIGDDDRLLDRAARHLLDG
ncbi:hypothetical protein MTR62_13190 [Novosphingobium sp. 1949]|uniref:PAS domain-containing protein n=1 Tax=Novosphingobium organovorum TaxID=2930092 RepID=A0ABT0BF36_9SPHN|nr:hypothetical protein [Novosphingobium organovorum]MCJ2183639.1 hypothetical protein [Novosphingobium organovorum]